MLKIKRADDCKWDVVSLGEMLLRFDPGDATIVRSREFRVWEGGAEYNVAADLSRVFGLRAAIVTAIHDNGIGRLAEDLAIGSGVDVSLIDWQKSGRNGLYFIERGKGLRAPSSAFDRTHTAISGVKPGQFDWTTIFKKRRTRWFHTGGVFAGLSRSTAEVAAEAMQAARAEGAVVSYDLNYRGSLWDSRGGRDAANKVNARLLEHADVVFGTFEFEPALDLYDEEAYRRASAAMFDRFPPLKLVVSTLRKTHSASVHDLGGVCSDGKAIYRSRDLKNVDVLDRVGSGDAFAAGFIAAVMEKRDLKFAVTAGAALGALTMTTPGDVSMSTASDVYRLIDADAPTVRR